MNWIFRFQNFSGNMGLIFCKIVNAQKIKGNVHLSTFFLHDQPSVKCWLRVFKKNVLVQLSTNLRHHRWTTLEFWFRNFASHWISECYFFGLLLYIVCIVIFLCSSNVIFSKIGFSIWDWPHLILFNTISYNLLVLFTICIEVVIRGWNRRHTHRFSIWWFTLFVTKTQTTN